MHVKSAILGAFVAMTISGCFGDGSSDELKSPEPTN
jgi:hypothetical protein